MKKVLIGVIIAAAIAAIGGVTIYENSSSKALSSASQKTATSETAVAATTTTTTNNTDSTAASDKSKSDTATKSDAKTDNTKQEKPVATANTTNTKTDAVASQKTDAASSQKTNVSASTSTTTSTKPSTTEQSQQTTATTKAPVSSTAQKEVETTPTKTPEKTQASKPVSSVVGPNQINQGTGNFSGLNSYPFMVATLSNGQQVIISMKNAQKEGNLLVVNGYYTNNIHTPVQFKISSLGNGAYNFYQMQDGGILSDFSVVSQGGSLFTGNNINTVGNDDESVGIQGIYQGSEKDGYYPGNMNYHPFYNGTVNGENVTFANLGNNNYLEYRAGSSTPYRISVTWNPFPNVNMQLDESLNGEAIGKFDITSFVYGSNTYSGEYFHYVNHTKAGVESRFSVSGSYSPN